MSKSKTVKKGKDGKRKESRAEKHARLESQQQAREACERILPYAIGGILLFVVMFALYVRSVPPKVKPPRITTTTTTTNTQPQGVPEFMNIKVDPKNPDAERAALDEAMRQLKEREAAANPNEAPDKNKGEPVSDEVVEEL